MVKLVDVRLTTIFPVKVTALCGFYCLNHLLVELLGRRNGFNQQNGCHQKRTGKEKLHLLNVLFFQQIMVTIAWVYRYRCKPAWLYIILTAQLQILTCSTYRYIPMHVPWLVVHYIMQWWSHFCYHAWVWAINREYCLACGSFDCLDALT